MFTLRKVFTASGFLATVKAMALTLVEAVVIMSLVVVIGIGVSCLLKRAADIPPIDRERAINEGTPPGYGNIAPYVASNGLPPKVIYIKQGDPLPVDMTDLHPLIDETDDEIYMYFEEVIFVLPKTYLSNSFEIGPNARWNYIDAVGDGTANLTGVTNEDFEVSVIDGGWNLRPTPAAMRKYPCMFWKATQ